MIRVMTLDTGDLPDHATNRLQQGSASTGPGNIDILCCQSIKHSLGGNEEVTRALAQSLELTCSCFAAHHLQHGVTEQQGVSGLAIMAGAGVWMLNSGSFPVLGDQKGEERIVQFALVRKNGASILVLNLQLAASVPSQRAQLYALFSHPLLKERYGAVVLCADRQTALSGKALRVLTARSGYAMHRNFKSARPSQETGTLCLLTAREQATTAVTLHNANVLLTEGLWGMPQPVLTLEFDMKRVVKDNKYRHCLPLSFREQWLGSKEKYPAFVA